jgi:YihY family inner membrane protein
MNEDMDPGNISRQAPLQLRNFLLGVIKHFLGNNGLLLAGGIAYYTLLSIIPVLVLILLFLSTLIDQQRLLDTLYQYLTLITPATADSLLEQVRHVINLPQLAGGVGTLVLLIFSGLAFRMLNDAMQVIFAHRHLEKKRHTLLSLSLPYLYVFAIAFAIGVIVTADAAYAALKNTSLVQHLPIPANTDELISFALGLSSEALLFTSFYLVMPVGKTPWKHALLGGFSAALLWEITRQLLTFWYSQVSKVNMIYGTFASVVLLLLMIEAGAIILLLGAQVIADYERTVTDSKSPEDE